VNTDHAVTTAVQHKTSAKAIAIAPPRSLKQRVANATMQDPRPLLLLKPRSAQTRPAVEIQVRSTYTAPRAGTAGDEQAAARDHGSKSEVELRSLKEAENRIQPANHAIHRKNDTLLSDIGFGFPWDFEHSVFESSSATVQRTGTRCSADR